MLLPGLVLLMESRLPASGWEPSENSADTDSPTITHQLLYRNLNPGRPEHYLMVYMKLTRLQAGTGVPFKRYG